MAYTSDQIVQMHNDHVAQYGFSPFDYTAYLPLLPIIGKYAETLKADSDMATGISAAYNDILAFQAKYADLIKRIQANIPNNQAFVNEALPVIKQASGS